MVGFVELRRSLSGVKGERLLSLNSSDSNADDDRYHDPEPLVTVPAFLSPYTITYYIRPNNISRLNLLTFPNPLYPPTIPHTTHN